MELRLLEVMRTLLAPCPVLISPAGMVLLYVPLAEVVT